MDCQSGKKGGLQGYADIYIECAGGKHQFLGME